VKAGTVRHADRAPTLSKTERDGARKGKGEKKSKFERADETPTLRKDLAEGRLVDYVGYGFDVWGQGAIGIYWARLLANYRVGFLRFGAGAQRG